MSQVQKYDAAGRLFAIVAALILAGNHGLTKGDNPRVFAQISGTAKV